MGIAVRQTPRPGLTQHSSQGHYSLGEAQVHHSLKICSFRVEVSPNVSLSNNAVSMRPLPFASLVTTAIDVVFQRMAVPTPYRSSEPHPDFPDAVLVMAR